MLQTPKIQISSSIPINDRRFCSVCNKPLLKQNRFRMVSIIHCDSCDEYIHQNCYYKHHINRHDLIAVIIE